ncbi:hypothetical protein Lal_00048040 [Lupinus albus]|nr:hypothetical protein Lal_00048040 [Lupinus albus]
MHGAADTPKKGSPSTTTFREQRASVEATTIRGIPATNQPCTVRPGGTSTEHFSEGQGDRRNIAD